MKKPTGNISCNLDSKPLLLMLLVLSVLSSCNIRKGVQVSLEIPVTRQLNPSKATTGTTSVCSFAETKTDFDYLVPRPDMDMEYVSRSTGDFPGIQHHIPLTSHNISTGWPLTSKVETYILFRQMKSLLPA